ncbi:Biogenesis Of Lysosome-Related Organelles Complex 1 Subunit 1 [Manis pentadactyla]|nr:Biogenesis Of Lysosome-Related Organelles Complex 1 Subunit 1 [Manis pentadactyla]
MGLQKADKGRQASQPALGSWTLIGTAQNLEPPTSSRVFCCTSVCAHRETPAGSEHNQTVPTQGTGSGKWPGFLEQFRPEVSFIDSLEEWMRDVER